jgi:uncharacterized protein YqeY
MDFNTKEYNDSILKLIDIHFNKVVKELSKFAQMDDNDMPQEEKDMKLTLDAIKLIKAELIRESNINYGTNKEYKNTKDQEVKVLLKMANNHKESMDGYKKVGNMEAYEKEKAELNVIEQFTPTQPSEEDIVNFTKEVIAQYLATKEEGYTPTMRDMGQIVPKVKAKYPNVDGNIIRKTLLEQ